MKNYSPGYYLLKPTIPFGDTAGSGRILSTGSIILTLSTASTVL